jgi:hypothetical protein
MLAGILGELSTPKPVLSVRESQGQPSCPLLSPVQGVSESLEDILSCDAPESALQISPSVLPVDHNDFGGVQSRGPSTYLYDIVAVILRHMRSKAGTMAEQWVLIAMLVAISFVLYHLFAAFAYVEQDIV